MVVYISCDIETDGPICNPNSILQLGSVSFNSKGDELDSFTVNLEELPNGSKCEKTMQWWSKQGDLYEKTRKDMVSASIGTKEYKDWLNEQGTRPVFIGYPAAWDFSFVYWYLTNFTGSSPFSHSALDIKTLAMVALKRGYRSISKSVMPDKWFSDSGHSHVAVEDAREQGQLFFSIMRSLSLET